MTRFAALVALFAAAPLFGQTKEVVEEVDALLAQQRIALRHAEERNEDIEVLRRLLNKTFGFDNVTAQLVEPVQPFMGSTAVPLAPPFGGGAKPAGDSGWRPGYQPPGFDTQSGGSLLLSSLSPIPVGKRVSQAVGPFDGVYLKGSGVVFTVRVPKEEMIHTNAPVCVGSIEKNLGVGSSCNTCHNELKAGHKGADAAAVNDCQKCHSTDVTSQIAKPVSDWDRIRADVRGEKLPSAAPSVAADPKKPRAVMCKPGDLRDLIVAQLHAHARNVRHLDKNDWFTVVVTFDEVPGAKVSRIPAPTEKPGFTPDELQSLTLGDLHLKQGKFKDAAEAYEKGLSRFQQPVGIRFPLTVPAADARKALAELEQSVRGTYKALATAYLQMNELDKAKTALDKATTLKLELATAGVEKARPALPAKLVLAVAKSDLDRNPPLAELRKGAHIETTGFPAEPAKK